MEHKVLGAVDDMLFIETWMGKNFEIAHCAPMGKQLQPVNHLMIIDKII